MSAAGVGPLKQLHGRVNANVYQNLQQHGVPSLHSLSNQPAISMPDTAHYHTVKQFLEAKNIVWWEKQTTDTVGVASGLGEAFI